MPKLSKLALTYCQGKSMINSINLEDGEEKFDGSRPWPAATAPRWWSAASTKTRVQAQAFTRERKLAIAERSLQLLTEKYGIPGRRHPVRPPGLSLRDRRRELHRRRRRDDRRRPAHQVRRCPHVKTVLGISNISFGLPAAAREVVNSVFLYHCTKAGLDLAIVNAEKLERFASLDPAERRSGRKPSVQSAGERTNRRIGASSRASRGSRSISITSRPSPSTFAAQRRQQARKDVGRRASARRAAGQLRHRRQQRRSRRRTWSASAPREPIRSTSSTGR